MSNMDSAKPVMTNVAASASARTSVATQPAVASRSGQPRICFMSISSPAMKNKNVSPIPGRCRDP